MIPVRQHLRNIKDKSKTHKYICKSKKKKHSQRKLEKKKRQKKNTKIKKKKKKKKTLSELARKYCNKMK